MKILVKDLRKGFVKAKIENLDDLWYLTYVIEKEDTLKAFTFRKIKLGGGEDSDAKVIKKPAVISIKVEKVEFAKFSNVLRVSGIITEGPEDIPLGSHHTLNLEENTEFSLNKLNFLRYQIEKLEESAKESKEKILIIVHDREEAYFALLKKYGFELLSQIKGNVTKKGDVKAESSDFFETIKKTLEEYDKKYNFSGVVIASPGFWKEYMQKQITENELKKKIVYATCSSASMNGINEVMIRPEVQAVLKHEKFAKEMEKVEELLTEISKQGKAEYGIRGLRHALEMGAVSELLITDSFIQKKRQEDKFQEIENIMKTVESMNGKIHIISSEHEGGKKLDGLTGIAALLRYKINY
jgi:protein pelota